MDTKDKLGCEPEVASVILTTSVEKNKKTAIDVSSYDGPVEVLPSDGKGAMARNVVTLRNVPVLEKDKRVTIEHSGTVEITPSPLYDGMKKVTAKVDIPETLVEPNKNVSIQDNGVVEVTPTAPYNAMGKVTANVALPLEDDKQTTINVMDYDEPIEVEPSSGNLGMKRNTVTLTGFPTNIAHKVEDATEGNFASLTADGDIADSGYNADDFVKTSDVEIAVTPNSTKVITSGGVATALNDKVDKQQGYGLSQNDFNDTLKNKLDGIQDGAEVNVQADWNESDDTKDDFIKNKPTIPAAQVNSDWNATSGVSEILNKPTLGTAAAKNSTNQVLDNSTDLVESGAVKDAIDSAISRVYKPSGNKTCAELVSALLIASNLGNVYNITDNGTTTSDFVEGAGRTIELGDNVAVVDVGTSQSPSYKFDLLSGMIDLNNYIQKSQTSGLVKNDGTIDQTAYAKQSEMSVTPGTGANADKTTIQLKTGTSATVLTQHIPASSSTPQMDGTGSAGSSTDYARADHVHPKDTSKQDVLTFDNVPTSGSDNPVKSSGIYSAIASAVDNVIYDTSITDCNNAFEKGKTRTYWLGPSVANIPNTNNGWYIISQCNTAYLSADNYVTQIATVASNVARNEIYIRHAYVRSSVVTWSNWEKLVKEIDLANALALPTDAVLHYSFDEVPDLPDGSAVERFDNNFTTDGWVDGGNRCDFSVTNGVLKMQQKSDASNANMNIRRTSFTYSDNVGKLVIAKVKVHKGSNVTGTVRVGIGNAGYVLQNVTAFDQWQTYMFVIPETRPTNWTSNNFYFTCSFGALDNENYYELAQFYLGNGSYNTPIIDNSGNGINATNNGAVAVQGVGGKGVFFIEGAKGKITTSATPLKENNSWTLSFWINLNEGSQTTGLNPRLYQFGSLEYCFISNFYKGYTGNRYFSFRTYINNDHKLNVDSISANTYKGQLIHIAVETEININGTSTKKVFINGVKIAESSTTTLNAKPTFNNGYIGGNTVDLQNQFLENSMIDDFQIFNRALSEQEVQALYLNRANTPKYYNLNNYELPSKQNQTLSTPITIDGISQTTVEGALEALNTAKELPPPPTTDGDYTLKVNIASGVATYTWEPSA